jgi:sulfonate transport system ATP-binding protein
MLTLKSVSKRYDGGHLAIDGIDLTIGEHEIVSLVGTSGCGKSTILRCIAGLESPTRGAIALDGQAVAGPTPEVAMLFQEPRLMPWLTVRENVRLALGGLSRAEQDSRIAAALADVGLSDAVDAWPKQLSGGMAQRAALSRALVARPSILLLDEPFAALDSFTKAKLQEHLLSLWTGARFTLVFVTHDVEEAAVLSDRIVVIRGQPGEVHSEIPVGIPRPRARTSAEIRAVMDRTVAALDLSQAA